MHAYIHTYITLHYITLHYITLRYTTLHYTTLHYITYIHTHTYMYILLYNIYIIHCFCCLKHLWFTVVKAPKKVIRSAGFGALGSVSWL